MNTNIVIIGVVLLLTLYLLSSNKTVSNSEYYYYGVKTQAEHIAEQARLAALNAPIQAQINANNAKIAEYQAKLPKFRQDANDFQAACDRLKGDPKYAADAKARCNWAADLRNAANFFESEIKNLQSKNVQLEYKKQT